MSLRQYVIRVLTEHSSALTLDEWLDEVAKLPPARAKTSGAEAVRRSRAADDERVARGRARR